MFKVEEVKIEKPKKEEKKEKKEEKVVAKVIQNLFPSLKPSCSQYKVNVSLALWYGNKWLDHGKKTK